MLLALRQPRLARDRDLLGSAIGRAMPDGPEQVPRSEVLTDVHPLSLLRQEDAVTRGTDVESEHWRPNRNRRACAVAIHLIVLVKQIIGAGPSCVKRIFARAARPASIYLRM